MSRLKDLYQKKVIPQLQKEFKISNKLAVSKINKVVVNMGIGEISKDKTAMQKAVETMAQITGQMPARQKARQAVADFKIREGDVIGLKTTLRGRRMYQFLDKLFNIVLPRVRDFRGVNPKSFDQAANFTLGMTEQIIFPEVDYDKIDKVRGLEVTIVTSTKSKKQAKRLLELLGIPFEKQEEKK
jgi:large subunit ribosomal protein L5